MKHILKILGFIVYLFSCCLTVPNDDLWYVPMIIAMFGMILVVMANKYGFKRNSKSDNLVIKIQNSNYSSEFEKLYNKIILDEILKG